MSRLLLKGFRKDGRSSQYGSIRKLSILMILAACFIMLVVVLAWFALDRVKGKIQAGVGDALQIVLHTTHEALNLWVESNKSQLTRLAEDPHLVSLTEHQLLVPRNKISLFDSKILMELRVFFQRHRDRERQTGFFIISPDFTNIVSMRNSNIGSKNLIANQALDLLNRAFRDGMVFHHNYYPVHDKAGAIIGVAIFAQDITERKHMEDELRRNVDELQRFSKVAFGREKKMIQLKKEINELRDQMNKDKKYKIVQ